jgi:hypothetical protein
MLVLATSLFVLAVGVVAFAFRARIGANLPTPSEGGPRTNPGLYATRVSIFLIGVGVVGLGIYAIWFR